MEQVTAWKPKCCNKAYLYKGNARRHEKNCPYNPDNKACATCGNCIKEWDEFYSYWCDHHEKFIEKYCFDENALQPQKHCEHWKPKEVESNG